MEPATDTEANLPRASPPVQPPLNAQADTINNNKQLHQQIPELLQPSIVAISLTYGFYQISAFCGLSMTYVVASQFTSYVVFAGLISSIIFYSKGLIASENCTHIMNLLYLASLAFVFVLYIVYWFVEPHWAPIPPPDLKRCLDSRKCAEHLHLVAQSAYMGCILINFICSLVF